MKALQVRDKYITIACIIPVPSFRAFNRFLTYTVYFICVLLVLWGISVKRGGQIHTDYLSLDAMKSIRGFAAIGVILHHISQEAAFRSAGELKFFVDHGYQYVAVFFFCSGYGLLKNLDTRPGYMDGFLKKRLPVIIIPYYTSIILYGIYNVIVGTHLEPLQWITNIVGISMMNEYAWYPVVLVILYIAFYFIFKREGSRTRKFVCMLILVLAMGVLFCVAGHFPWWAGSKENWWIDPNSIENGQWWMRGKVWLFCGEWWINSPIAFLVGMIYETYEDKFTGFFSENYVIKFGILAVLTLASHTVTYYVLDTVGYYTEAAGNGPGIGDKFLCYFSQLPHVILYALCIYILTMKVRSVNPVSRFFGKYSLDTYMMNLMAILIFRPLFLTDQVRIVDNAVAGRWLFLICVFAVTIILGVFYHKINEVIRKALRL